jgi:anthranilate/para-aminobenzoate synthase component I
MDHLVFIEFARRFNMEFSEFIWMDSGDSGRFSILAPFEAVDEEGSVLWHAKPASIIASENDLYECGFQGGYFALLPYELHWRTLARPKHCRPLGTEGESPSPASGESLLLCRVHRWLTYDHKTKIMFSCRLATNLGEKANPLDDIFGISNAVLDDPARAADFLSTNFSMTKLACRDSEAGYLEKIRRCQEFIKRGESYELCLTTKFEADFSGDPFLYYLKKRDEHNAPFSVFVKHPNVCVASFSPEEFLKVDFKGKGSSSSRERIAQMKPIKGTSARHLASVHLDEASKRALYESIKERAENLMITDLIRNDLGKIAIPGSVKVPNLFQVETFPTCHHLVSTITATLKQSIRLTDILNATFPPGKS